MEINELQSFVDGSPTSYQVVEHIGMMAAGFIRLDPADAWHLEEGGKYYLVSEDGAMLLFSLGKREADTMAFRTVISHTDSPALRLIPGGIRGEKDGVRMDVEPYGAIIYADWFDRPLSLAGRILVEGGTGVRSVPVDFRKPVAIIPHLAPHLHKEVNTGYVFKAGKDLVPLGAKCWEEGGFLKDLASLADVDVEKVLDYDLYFYPYGDSTRVGADEEWLASPRLDNLATAYPAVMALFDSRASDVTRVVYLADQEEIGSLAQSGGDSSFLGNVLRRIVGDLGEEAYFRALARSFLLSCDMAHADHPNYRDWANPSASPVLGGGVTVKLAASRSYATQGHSSARFKRLMEKAGLKVQTFANPHGQRGGSTIGPLSLRHVDMEAIDIGIPMWAMHGANEVVHVADVLDFYKAMVAFFDAETV
ncbi:MAG: M18 family aminopeptidase [Peptoniphilus sp.]|nr:M18 family aminopeptidase [Peptoniphilus sp.]MDY3118395.1 M18 family aminopeptidase [Peptoniphilus sp.]